MCRFIHRVTCMTVSLNLLTFTQHFYTFHPNFNGGGKHTYTDVKEREREGGKRM